ncbi:MAG: aminopeptidase [Candidatus Hadarchaeum sp.]|uniref:aminopeptidase n=1 Tax=Candidatus Hadarchaeum sp. TaxID=2883567 RepID=UPI003D10BACB
MNPMIRGAKIVVDTCLRIRRGETVLIVTDPPKMKIAETIADVARERGTAVTLICMPVGQRHGQEPPEPVALAMTYFDVVIAPTTYSITHTQARKRACAAGARVATMPGITEEMMQQGAMLADYQEVARLTKKVAALLDRASEVEVTTEAGTELSFSIKGRKTHPDTGLFHRPGDFGNLPAGEAFIAPVEGTGEGRVVVDGSIIDTTTGRTEIIIEKGMAKKISGSAARKLTKMLDEAGPKARNLAEFGVGTNSKARLIGQVLEDEKVLGTCHVALGDNSTFGGRVKAGIHIDGIFKNPTVTLDGKLLMETGRLLV